MPEYALKMKPKAECKYDLVGLGEMMLRFEPMPVGFTQANALGWITHLGGGEINSQINGAILGLDTASVTALPDHMLGIQVRNYMRGVGVDTQYIQMLPYDGVGRTGRLGLNFTTPGNTCRPNKVIYDRSNCMAGKAEVGDTPWEDIFAQGVRIFHTGGIYAAVSTETPNIMRRAMAAARAEDTEVSYDINLRDTMWAGLGGMEEAARLNQELVRDYVTILFGNEKDFKAMGIEADAPGDKYDVNDDSTFKSFAETLMGEFPNLKVIGRSMRNEMFPDRIDWGGFLCTRLEDGSLEFGKASPRMDIILVERTGGGDAFYLGSMMGYMDGKSTQEAAEYGAALSAIKMSNKGDTLHPGTTMTDLEAEVSAAKVGGSRRTQR